MRWGSTFVNICSTKAIYKGKPFIGAGGNVLIFICYGAAKCYLGICVIAKLKLGLT